MVQPWERDWSTPAADEQKQPWERDWSAGQPAGAPRSAREIAADFLHPVSAGFEQGMRPGLETARNYGSAIQNNLAAGMLGIQGGVGTFVQAPAANTLAGVTGARALLNRGITNLANWSLPFNKPLEEDADLQEEAQRASRFAAETRAQNVEGGEAGWLNPRTTIARLGLGLQEDARERQTEIQKTLQETNPEFIRQSKAVQDAQGFFPTVAAMAQNPLALTGTMARSAPDMALGLGVARLAATRTLAGAGGAADAAAARAAAAGGDALAQGKAAKAAVDATAKLAVERASQAGMLAESVSSANQARESVYQEVKNLPPEKLAASPRFQKVLREVGGDVDRAREVLANELADQAVTAGLGTMAGSLATRRLFGGDTTAKAVAGTERMTAREIPKNMREEIVEEGIQGPLEDLAQHGAGVQADPTRQYDLGGSVAQNMVAGAAMSGPSTAGRYAQQRIQDMRGNGAQPASDQTKTGLAVPVSPESPPATTPAIPRKVRNSEDAVPASELLGDAPEPSAEEKALTDKPTDLTPNRPRQVLGADTRFSTEAGAKLDASYALMDAGDMVTSHDESLRSNDAYPQELQPRDRERAASATQITGIQARLDPARLGASGDAGTGAPIVGEDGVVESGNARTIALKRVYRANGQQAQDYRGWLRDNAAQFGITPDAVDAMKQPVLVRVRTTPVDRAEFARQANASTVAAMSPSEQARSDANRIEVMDDLKPDDNGDFATSRDFIRRFMARLPVTEQGGMVDAQGQLSSTGYARVRNAVLAKAYGDSPVLTRMVESLDDNTRNISKALLIAAPQVAQARQAIGAGRRFDADITPHLVDAAQELSRLRDAGRTVDGALAQLGLDGDTYTPETRALLRFLADNSRRPRRIAEFIGAYFDALDAAGDPNQGSLLGENTGPTKGELLTAAKRSTDAAMSTPASPGVTPAPVSGMVRMYHGGVDGAASGPVWFTRDLRNAKGWAAKAGDGASVSFVDLPKDHPALGGDEQYGVLPPENIQLPADISARRARFNEGAPGETSIAQDTQRRNVGEAAQGGDGDGRGSQDAAGDRGGAEGDGAAGPGGSGQEKAELTPEERRAAATQRFKNALGDLAEIASKHTRVTMLPEDTPGLMPTLVELFSAAIEIVGSDLAATTKWVKAQMRDNAATKKLVNLIKPETYRKAAERALADRQRSGDAGTDGLFASGELPALPQRELEKSAQADLLGEEPAAADPAASEATPDEPAAPTGGSDAAAGAARTIEDAGEKIGGARKDLWKERGLQTADLDAMTEAEGATVVTKANVWKPDYQAMAEDIGEPVTVAMVKVVYDSLAAKPKANTQEGRRDYVRAMQAVRQVYGAVRTPEQAKGAFEQLRAALGVTSGRGLIVSDEQKVARRVLFSVYKGRSDPFILSYNELARARKLVADGFPGAVEPWTRRFVLRSVGGEGTTERGVEIYLADAARVGTPITVEELRAGAWKVTDKAGRVQAYAATKDGAEAAAKAVYERQRDNGDLRTSPDRPHLDKIARENLVRTIDRDVAPSDLIEAFGFRGIEFGNWAAQDERQKILNLAYDAMGDLAKILGVPQRALSLNGTMGLAFGARGGGQFAAHYEPGKLVINMTKLRGAGSLAHEWAHAFDHYLGELDRADAYQSLARGASGWMNEERYEGRPVKRMVKDASGKWTPMEQMRMANLRPELATKVDALMRRLFNTPIPREEAIAIQQAEIERVERFLAGEQDSKTRAVYEDGLKQQRKVLEGLLAGEPSARTKRSSFAAEAQKLSGKSTSGYWLRPTEMFARAFESYVFDRLKAMGAKSEYLVHGVEADRFADGTRYKGNPYPSGEERAAINSAFDDLVGEIKTRPGEDGNVVLFSRGATGGIAIKDLLAVSTRVKQRLPGLPPVHVLLSPESAPPALQDHIRERGATADVEGAFHEGAIYLFASGIADEARAEHVLAEHEAAHAGLRGLLGPKLGQTLQAIESQNASVRRAATAMRAANPGMSVAESVEEVLVDMPSGTLAKLKGWRALVGRVRDWMAGHGFDRLAARLDGWLAGTLTEQQRADLFVADLVREARAFAGRPASGQTRLSGQLSDDLAGQEKWLTSEAKARGYSSIDDLLDRAPEVFEKLATLWREKNPAESLLSPGKVPQVDTPAFKRWFGESKVVDGLGRPLVMYHSTLADITEFHGGKVGAIFAASNHGDAEKMVAERAALANSGGLPVFRHKIKPAEGQNTMPVYVRAVNPFDGDNEKHAQALASWLESEMPKNADLKEGIQRALGMGSEPWMDKDATNLLSQISYENYLILENKHVVKWMKDQGYDGLWVREFDDEGGRNIGVFSSEQIKSAIGNTGAFDLANPDIRLSAAPQPKDADQRAQDIIDKSAATAKPIDALAKVLTRYTGIEKIAGMLYDKGGMLIDRVTPERMKAGFVSDYGVPEAVIDQRAMMIGRQRTQLREAGSLVGALASLTRAESRVAYEWMNGEDTRKAEELMKELPEESVKVLQQVQQMVDKLSREAVRLGQLDPEAFERHRFAYLRRSYYKHAAELQKGDIARRQRAITVLGDQYKGRGMVEKASMKQIQNVAPEWWKRKMQEGKGDTSLKDEKFTRFERRAASGEGTTPMEGVANKPKGKLLEVNYWPAGEKAPAKYADWDNAGTWEVRDTKGADLIVWRDFTKEERTTMGEIDEARFAVAKTLQGMIHDVEVGRYLEWLGQNYAKLPGETIEGEIVDPSERYLDTFKPGQWVEVPSTPIPGTQVKKYGKLAGQFVPGPVWNDLRQVVSGRYKPLGDVYDKVLQAWKISKTALSPAVHTNNVMSNFVMADWHDVTAGHVAKALRIMLAASKSDRMSRAGIADRDAAKVILGRYSDSGGAIGTWATEELMSEQLEPIVAALQAEVNAAGERGGQAEAGVYAALQALLQKRFADAFDSAANSKPGMKVRKGAATMIDAYQAEDDVFRLAAWLKAKEEGATDQAAGKVARKSFLDYSINAPWVQAMRSTAFPFISFTYRAVPLLLETAGKRPHKLMKLMMLAGMLNWLGVLAGGGDDKERKLLPEEKAGRVWGLVPKLVRMPWNDANGSPVYLDIRRWIPVGDVADVGAGHSAVPVLPSLVPGGPVALMFELYNNNSMFTGKPITLETDTGLEKTGKVIDYLWKAFAPNLLGVPGTYATSGVVDAIKGATDKFGREQSVAQALLSSVGIKLGSYPADVLRNNLMAKHRAEEAEIDKNIGALKRQMQTHRMDADEFAAKVQAQNEKKLKLLRELSEKMN